MKAQSSKIFRRGTLIAASAVFAAAIFESLLNSTAQAAQNQGNNRGGLLIQSSTMGSQPGSPVGQKQKIIVCYKGKEVKRIDYKKFLKYQEKEPGKYTAGPCATWTLVCENNHDVKWIKSSGIDKWLGDHKNRSLGNCTGVRPDDERVICWKGWTILVKVKELIKYPGYSLGVCP